MPLNAISISFNKLFVLLLSSRLTGITSILGLPTEGKHPSVNGPSISNLLSKAISLALISPKSYLGTVTINSFVVLLLNKEIVAVNITSVSFSLLAEKSTLAVIVPSLLVTISIRLDDDSHST